MQQISLRQIQTQHKSEYNPGSNCEDYIHFHIFIDFLHNRQYELYLIRPKPVWITRCCRKPVQNLYACKFFIQSDHPQLSPLLFWERFWPYIIFQDIHLGKFLIFVPKLLRLALWCQNEQMTPTFYYFFIIFLTCYNSVASFIYNLCYVLLLGNHLKVSRKTGLQT